MNLPPRAVRDRSSLTTLATFFVACVASTVFFFWMPSTGVFLGPDERTSPLVAIWALERSLFAIVCYWLLFFRDRFHYSLRQIFYVFILLFFLYASYAQLYAGVFFWGSFGHDIPLYLRADGMVALFVAMFELGYARARPLKLDPASQPLNSAINPWTLLALHAAVVLFYATAVGVPEMFFRATNKLSSLGSSVGLIVGHFVKGLSPACLVFTVMWARGRKGWAQLLPWANGLMFLLLYWPTSAARFQIGGAYIGVYLAVRRKLSSRFQFLQVLMFGLLVVWPLMGSLRHALGVEDLLEGTDVGLITSHFYVGDFDAFQMLVNGYLYVEHHGMAWGKQLLGALLFFVPRAIWPGKAVGTGTMIADTERFSFSNISMPPVGEGYVNFGLAGVALFGLAWGLLSGIGDKTYWSKWSTSPTALVTNLYPFLVGFFLFLNRGDMLSSFAYTVALTLSFVAVRALSVRGARLL